MEFQSGNEPAARSNRTVGPSTGAAPVAAQRVRNAGQLDRAAVVRLQRSIGNRATTRVLQRSNEGTRYAHRGEFARVLTELNDRLGVAGAERPRKPAKQSAVWKWMKGKSPHWLQAVGLALGLGTAGAKENQPIKPDLQEVRKPLEVEEAEREGRDRSRSKKAPQAGPDPPRRLGAAAPQEGTRYADRGPLASMLKELNDRLGVTGQEPRPQGRSRTPAKRDGGTGGVMYGFAGSMLQAALAGAAMDKRIDEKRQKTGYAEPGSEYEEDAGFWGRVESTARAGTSFFAGEEYPMSKRFDAGVWRRSLRAKADRVPNDGTLEIGWQIQVGWKESLNPLLVAEGTDVAEIETVRTVYRKMAVAFGDPPIEAVGWAIDTQQSQRWPPSASVAEPPSLNYILNPRNSDSEVESYLHVPMASSKEV